METTAPNGTKLAIARVGIFIFLIGLGLRVFFQAHQEETPVAVAAPISNVTTAPAPTGDPAPDSAVVVFVRLEWLSQCVPAQEQLGLYAAGDAPCRPGATASLGWLQSQLNTTGMLGSGEYLVKAANPNNPACVAQILSGTTGRAAGWVCSDQNGLYRTDASGSDSGGRMQLWMQGS